jgi:hypothetical protein
VQASTRRGLEDRAQFTVVHQAPWAQLSAALLRSDALPRTVVCSLLAGADDTSAVWGSGSRRRQLQLVDLFFQTSVAVFPVHVQLQQFLVMFVLLSLRLMLGRCAHAFIASNGCRDLGADTLSGTLPSWIGSLKGATRL